MILTELSAPPAAAVPLRAFAEHLRLGTGFADDGSQDAVLEAYLRAAMAAIEARLGRVLLARPFSFVVSRWSEAASQGLPVAPVVSVEAVTMRDADGFETVVEPELWSLMRDRQRPRLVGRFGRSLPRVPRGGQVEVSFTAGYGAVWEAVPADLRQAAMMLAAHFYENRTETGAISGTMPFGVLMLLESHRTMRLGARS